MIRFIRIYGSKVYTSVIWTALTIFLLCLPGDNIPPEEKIFEIKNLDKLVHAVLFGLLVLFWSLWAYRRKSSFGSWARAALWITIGSILLGIAMEYVQRYFIPFRDFEVGDIVADTVGALAAFWFLRNKGRASGLLEA